MLNDTQEGTTHRLCPAHANLKHLECCCCHDKIIPCNDGTHVGLRIELKKEDDAKAEKAEAKRLAREEKALTTPRPDHGRDWTERDFQREFDKWFTKQEIRKRFTKSCLIELKATPNDSIPFDCLEQSQRKALDKCQTDDGVYHRIQSNANKFQSAKPSDGFFLRNADAFVAVMFEIKKKGNKDFFIIRFKEWIQEETVSERKSLTKERASEIGKKCFL